MQGYKRFFTRRRRTDLLWLLAVMALFLAVDCMSMHTGDDLGYMFADTAHHAGDGERVTTFAQCVQTQCMHYFTTNGRFAVHVLVMAFLNLMPLWVFRTVNALMFALLWLGMVTLVRPSLKRPDSPGAQNMLRALTWLLLLAGFPMPAVVLFTLVSYAANYLWTATAMVWLVVLCRRLQKPHRRALTVAAAVAAMAFGTLHEGFSLPLCAAFLVAALMRRLPWTVFLSLVAGIAVCVFAPGNMHHAAQGGGLALGALYARNLALLADAPWLLLFQAIAVALVIFMVHPRRTLRFLGDALPAVAAIVGAVALAVLTYTSPRQLSCPTVIAVFLILKAVSATSVPCWCNLLFRASLTATVLFTALLVVLRVGPYQRWQQFRQQSLAGNPYPQITAPAPLLPDAPAVYPLRAMAPDPTINRALMANPDPYTTRALRRLRPRR